jgi:hypothetical protein
MLDSSSTLEITFFDLCAALALSGQGLPQPALRVALLRRRAYACRPAGEGPAGT